MKVFTHTMQSAVITKGVEHGFNKHVSIADMKSLIY